MEEIISIEQLQQELEQLRSSDPEKYETVAKELIAMARNLADLGKS